MVKTIVIVLGSAINVDSLVVLKNLGDIILLMGLVGEDVAFITKVGFIVVAVLCRISRTDRACFHLV